jgi:hypothetical protein
MQEAGHFVSRKNIHSVVKTTVIMAIKGPTGDGGKD